MKSSSNPGTTWLLFCKERVLKRRLDWTCVCWPRKVEAEFSLTCPGHVYNLAVDGLLLGAKFHLEAWSRRRLEGDVRDSHVPLFVGSFEHQGGMSGAFTIRPRDDGELTPLTRSLRCKCMGFLTWMFALKTSRTVGINLQRPRMNFP